MSLLTTPSRSSRGQIVASLDTTKPAIDDIATAITYAGLHTPPQSANENRRPSSQYSWFDESCPPSAISHSQPSTPINRIQHGRGTFTQHWSDLEMAGPCADDQLLATHFVDPRVQNDSLSTPLAVGFAPFHGATKQTAVDAFGLHLPLRLAQHDVWAEESPSISPFAAESRYMASELLPLTDSPPSENNAVDSTYYDPNLMLGEFPTRLDANGFASNADGVSQGSTLYQQHPQVVVPSQLSPQDIYYQSHFREYATPGLGDEAYDHSLPSSASTSFGSFESMDPPSPTEMYFSQPDEEYMMVKSEETLHGNREGTTRRLSASSKKRAGRAPRGVKPVWHTHNMGVIEVRCEGEKFPLDGPSEHNKKKKNKFVCEFLDRKGGACGRGFDRNEHLTRHEISHTGKRPYGCPVCDRFCSRSDNACDHFKTHLRKSHKGRRNANCGWPELRDGIILMYEDKRAMKLIENIQKWIDAGMPDSGKKDRR